jgi:hypothetical protein
LQSGTKKVGSQVPSGVEKREQLGVGLPPGFLDRRPVAAVLLEDDQVDLIEVAAGQLDGVVSRPIADHGDVDVDDAGLCQDLGARPRDSVR